MKLIFSALLSTLVFASSAQAFNCFRPERQFPRHRVLNSNTVRVQALFGEVYDLRVGSCWELGWGGNEVAFERGLVCENDDLYVVDRYSNKVVDRCWILEVTKYEPEEDPDQLN